MQDKNEREMSKIFLHCLFCGRVIEFSKLVSSGYLIALTFIWSYQGFHKSTVLILPSFLLDFLILDYYVQSHVNTFLWHLSCTNSFVCGFKQALMHRQVVEFIQSFQMGKNKFTKQLKTVPRALFIAKERGPKTLRTKLYPQVYLGEHLDLPQVTRRRIWTNEFNQD